MKPIIFSEELCFRTTSIPLYVTLYQKKDIRQRAALLYFHGGGLLCGNRHDLPDYHIDTLCLAGYSIFAFDYRLAPATKIPEILDDVTAAVRWYLKKRGDSRLPYFLWGRSAGAYLALLAGRQTYEESPRGILSYYGYAFLENYWYNTPSDYYQKLPKVDLSSLAPLRDEVCADAPLEERFALYIRARQQGNWIQEIYDNREKYFYAPYSFRLVDSFQNYPPVFMTHATGDPDVPFAEAKALYSLLPNTTEAYYVSVQQHDYDRNIKERATVNLLEKTLAFLDQKTT